MIAASDSSLAMKIISNKTIPVTNPFELYASLILDDDASGSLTIQLIKDILENTENIQLKTGCVQCLGSLSKYSLDHCKAVQEFDILNTLLALSKEHVPVHHNIERIIEKYSRQKESTAPRSLIGRTQLTGEDSRKITRSIEQLYEACEVAIQQVIRNSLNVDWLLSYLEYPQKEKQAIHQAAAEVVREEEWARVCDEGQVR